MRSFWRQTYPVHISELALAKVSVDDVVHDGFSTQQIMRSIYEVQDIIIYKNQILSISANDCLVNILGVKAERRNFIGAFGPLDQVHIQRAPTTSVQSEHSYLFLPQNPKKENYWHCIIDNISQLLFVLEHFPKIHVFYPSNLSQMLSRYLYFLRDLYRFDISPIPQNGGRFKGAVLMADPSLFGEFVHNKLQTARTLKVANEEMNKTEQSPLTAIHKFGDVPHGFIISNGSNKQQYIKNYSIPISTPFRKSIFTSLANLRNDVVRGDIKPHKIIYIHRKTGKKKDPVNEAELLEALVETFGAELVDFADLSFEEQIKLASQSKALIGVHGAGMANLAFMTPGAALIDIVPPDYSLPKTTEFEVAAKLAGLNHATVECRSRHGENNQNYEVNIATVISAVAENIDQLDRASPP
jgi:hypothetical protein